MARTTPLQDLARKGRELDQLLTRYRAFVDKTVEKYERASNGGPIDIVASTIARESEQLTLTLETDFDYAKIAQNPPDAFQREALDRKRALYRELRPYFAPGSYHQSQVADALDRNSGATQTEVARLKRDQPKIAALIREFDALFSAALDNSDDPHSFASKNQDSMGRKDTPRPNTSTRDHEGGKTMSDANGYEKGTTEALGDIVDAISRLQTENNTSPAAGSSSAYNAFGADLDQKLQTTLGMPNLNSDGALAMDRQDLLDKLFDGLDRSVNVVEQDALVSYQFNPLKARSASTHSEMNALGAQAVTADHIRALKGPILLNLHRMTPELVFSDQDEADDLRRAIEAGVDKLAIEASAELGAFDIWASELLEQIFRDLLSLASLYGIKSAGELKKFAKLTIQPGDTIDTVFSAIPLPGAKARLLKDPDIGILTAEANDKAIMAITLSLVTISQLLVGDGSLGPILGRVRAFNDAISASVISARNALATAGVSVEDQIVSFSDGGTAKESSISLRRLLAWVESESIMARTTLTRADLNGRDLDRLRSARETQLAALAQINAGEFATVNNSRYALGRRHLNELEQHLCAITGLFDELIKQSSSAKRTAKK